MSYCSAIYIKALLMSYCFRNLNRELKIVWCCVCHCTERFLCHVLVELFVKCGIHFSCVKELRIILQLFCLSSRIKYFSPSSLLDRVSVTPAGAAYNHSQYNLQRNKCNYSLSVIVQIQSISIKFDSIHVQLEKN